MIPWTQVYRCKEHGVFDLLVHKPDRDKPHPCPECGAASPKSFGVPRIATASLPDGTKRRGFQELKEAERIRREMYNLPEKKREKHKQEIKRLERL